MSTDHYDVIIIGTGAGGGTLAHRARAVRQAHPAARARRLRAAREGELGLARGRRREPLPRRRRRGATSTASEFHPGTHYYVGGNTKFYGAALFRLRERGLRRGPPPRRHLARLADRATTSSSRTTRRPSTSTTCTAQRGVDPTEPPASAPYPHPAGQPRAAHPAARRRPRRALGHRPFPMPLGIMLDETEPAHEPLHPLRHLRRLPVPRQRARPTRRSICVEPALAHPNVTLLTDAYVDAARDERLRPRGDARCTSSANGERGDVLAPTIVVVVVRRRSTRRRCCCARRTTGTRTGLANGSGVVGRHYMCHLNSMLLAISRDPNPTRFQKTLGPQRLLLRRRRTGSTRWATSR